MITSKDGKLIQATEISFEITKEAFHSAKQNSLFLNKGFERVIAEEVGLELTDVKVFRTGINQESQKIEVHATSEWQPPTRR